MAGSLGALVVDLGLDISKLAGGVRAAEAELKSLGADADKAARTIGQAGRRMTAAVTLPALAAGGFAVKAFADFDDQLNKSVAIMGDVSDVLRNDMADAARDVALTTVISAKDAAEAYFFLASAGLDAQQSIAALPQVAAFAQAGMFDMATATDLATDAQSALGLSVDSPIENLKNLTRVTDVLVKSNTLANASVEQFATSLTNKAGAALKVVGKEIEEGVAVLAAFADQGVKGEEAGNALNIVFRDLQTRAISNKKAFQDAGVAVFDSAGEFRNIADVIGDLERALSGMSDEQAKATLLQLGFADRSVSFLQVLLGTSDAIRGYEFALKEAGGTTQEVADKQLKSFTAQMKLFKNQVTDVAITVGSILAPMIASITKSVAPAIKAFREMNDSQRRVVIGLVAAAAAVGPLLIAVSALTALLPFLVAGFSALFVAIPIVATIGIVVAALGAIFINASSDADTFAERATDSLGTVAEAAQATFDTIQGLPDLLLIQLTFFAEAGDAIVGGFFENILTIAIVTFDSIMRVISIVATNLGTVFKGIATIALNVRTAFITNFADAFKSMLNLAVEFVKALGDVFSNIPELLSGQMSLEEFNKQLIDSDYQKAIEDVFDATDIFKGVDLGATINVLDQIDAALSPDVVLRDVGTELGEALTKRDKALEDAMNINTKELGMASEQFAKNAAARLEKDEVAVTVTLDPSTKLSQAIEFGSVEAFNIARGIMPESDEQTQKKQLETQKKNLTANEKQAKQGDKTAKAIDKLAAALQPKGIL